MRMNKRLVATLSSAIVLNSGIVSAVKQDINQSNVQNSSVNMNTKDDKNDLNKKNKKINKTDVENNKAKKFFKGLKDGYMFCWDFTLHPIKNTFGRFNVSQGDFSPLFAPFIGAQLIFGWPLCLAAATSPIWAPPALVASCIACHKSRKSAEQEKERKEKEEREKISLEEKKKNIQKFKVLANEIARILGNKHHLYRFPNKESVKIDSLKISNIKFDSIYDNRNLKCSIKYKNSEKYLTFEIFTTNFNKKNTIAIFSSSKIKNVQNQSYLAYYFRAEREIIEDINVSEIMNFVHKVD